MRQKRLLSTGVFIGALLWATSALAQQSDPFTDLEKRVERFFAQVASNNVSGAYLELLDSKLIGSKEERGLLEEETAKIESVYGTYRGYERVYAKQVGNDLVFMKYLYKCSRFPVLWHLTFYRSPTGSELASDNGTWQVVSIRFDTDLEVLTLLNAGAAK